MAECCFVLILLVAFVEISQQTTSDEADAWRVHSGNLCTILCSGSSSVVAKSNAEPTALQYDGISEASLSSNNLNKQNDIEFIKENLRNNSLELSAIRGYLNEIILQQELTSSSQNDSQQRGSISSSATVGDLRIARAGNGLPRHRAMSANVEPGVPEIVPTAVDRGADNLDDNNNNNNVITSIPTDCEEVRKALGKYFIGRYYTKVKLTSDEAADTTLPAVLVGCELREDAGWTIIQKRVEGILSFDRSWDEYKNGFGDIEGEFWLGNDNIHRLTGKKPYRLRIELQTGSGRKFFAEYSSFSVADEADNYRLNVSGYAGGSAGDALTGILSHHGAAFTTRDRDNDKYEAGNCAVQYHGGWWFHSCFVAFLNGAVANSSPPSGYTTRDTSSWHARKVRSFYVPAMSQEGIVWRTINKRQTRDSAYYDDVAIKMAMMMVAPV